MLMIVIKTAPTASLVYISKLIHLMSSSWPFSEQISAWKYKMSVVINIIFHVYVHVDLKCQRACSFQLSVFIIMIVSTNSILLIAIYDYIYNSTCFPSCPSSFLHVMSIIIMTCFSAVSSVSSAMFCSIKRFALFCRSNCFSASSRWTLVMMVTMRMRSTTITTMVMKMRVLLPLQLFLSLFSMHIDHDGHDDATMVSWMTTTTTTWWWQWRLLLLLLLLLVTKAN